MLAFWDWKEEDKSCKWAGVVIGKAVHQGNVRTSEYRTNECNESLLLTSCCGSLVLFFNCGQKQCPVPKTCMTL